MPQLFPDAHFRSNGGFIGLDLTHKYPFNAHTNLSPIEDYLKGTDVAFEQVCEDLDLKAAYIEDYENVWALVDKFLEFNGEQSEDGISEYLTPGGYNTEIVVDVSKSLSSTYS